MKNTILILTICLFAFNLAGCGNGPDTGQDVVNQVQNMKPEERFELIKNNTGMSYQMKAQAVDNLPVSDEQKKTWKEELMAGTPSESTR